MMIRPGTITMRTPLHFGEGAGVEHAARLVCHRHVDGDVIRVPVDVVEITDQLDPHALARASVKKGS